MPYNFPLLVDIGKLRSLQKKIYSPAVLTIPDLECMTSRMQDFTLSHAKLNTQFSVEHHIALTEFPASTGTTDLMSRVSTHSEMRVEALGEDHFTSRELSPALRHLLNDSCRLLEPTISFLAAKFPGQRPPRSNESLNRYIIGLQQNQCSLPFDAQFILEIYEVWNDYKHRQTSSLYATSWKYESGSLVKAKLGLPVLNVSIQALGDLDIDTFANQTCEKLLEYLDFVI